MYNLDSLISQEDDILLKGSCDIQDIILNNLVFYFYKDLN